MPSAMAPPYDIQARAFEFAVQVLLWYRQLPKVHDCTRVLARRQLLDSATSVGANLEEADGGQTKPDFRAKLATARKEAKESVYWLRLQTTPFHRAEKNGVRHSSFGIRH